MNPIEMTMCSLSLCHSILLITLRNVIPKPNKRNWDESDRKWCTKFRHRPVFCCRRCRRWLCLCRHKKYGQIQKWRKKAKNKEEEREWMKEIESWIIRTTCRNVCCSLWHNVCCERTVPLYSLWALNLHDNTQALGSHKFPALNTLNRTSSSMRRWWWK